MNGNPFYVPPVIPDMSDTIMGLGRLSMEKERMANDSAYRKETLAQGQQGLDIQQQNVTRQIPASQRPWDESNVTKMKNQLRLKGLDPDKMPDVFEPLDAMAKDKSMTRGDVAGAIEQGWDTDFKPRLVRNLGEQSEALAKKAAGMKEDDPNRAKVEAEIKKLEELQSSFAQIKPEHVVPGFFSDIAEERANSKAAIQALRGEERPTIIPAGGIAMKGGKVIGRNPKPAAEEKKITEAEKRMERKEVADAEEKILANQGNPATQPQIDLFNERADKPYAYVLEEGKMYGMNTRKIDLPVINKKQVTAKDVYFTAEKRGMTFDQVLQEILKGKK